MNQGRPRSPRTTSRSGSEGDLNSPQPSSQPRRNEAFRSSFHHDLQDRYRKTDPGNLLNEPTLDQNQIDPGLVKQITQNVLRQLQEASQAQEMDKTLSTHAMVPATSKAWELTPSQSYYGSPSSFAAQAASQAKPYKPPLSSDTEGTLLEQRGHIVHEPTVLEKVWGAFYDDEGSATPRLAQLLRSIAAYIVDIYDPAGSLVITPDKMQNFYTDYKVSNEVYPWSLVFDDRTSSISRMLRELRVEHCLVQPSPDMRPDIPALTQNGFASWMSTAIQAHPDVEYERLSQVVGNVLLRNPDDQRERFPTEILRSQFPTHSNQETAEKLRTLVSIHCNIKISPILGTVVDSNVQVFREYMPQPVPIERERKPYVAHPGAGKSWAAHVLGENNRKKTPPLIAHPDQSLSDNDKERHTESKSLSPILPTAQSRSPLKPHTGSNDLTQSPVAPQIENKPKEDYIASYDQPSKSLLMSDSVYHHEDGARSEQLVGHTLDDSLEASFKTEVQPKRSVAHSSGDLISNEDEVQPEPYVEPEQTVPMTTSTSPHSDKSTEPSIQAEPQRVTWTCSCGAELFDYYTEVEPGSIDQLRKWFQNQYPPPEKDYVNRMRNWVIPASFPMSTQPEQSMITKGNGLSASISQSSSGTTSQIPAAMNVLTSSDPKSSTSTISTALPTTPAATVVSYLLLCIPEGLSGLKLQHLQIIQRSKNNSYSKAHHITNDKELFQSLRAKYRRERKLFISRFWPKTVIRVSLAYFLVDLSEYIELKHYACRGSEADRCKCIPPRDLIQPSPNAQYCCFPRDPPFKPPIGTNYLTHYFQNHSCIRSDRVAFVLNQLPKRMGQCMVTSPVDRMEGWGLEFEEGWDPGRLRTGIFVTTLIGSLIFAFLWAILKKDPQTAFTISAFCVGSVATLCAYTASAEPRIIH